MALLTFCSAGGSPGVTATVVALALAWPRPVLVVEADPTGSSAILPGYRQGLQVTDRSAIDLAIALRQGHIRQTLLAGSIPLSEGNTKAGRAGETPSPEAEAVERGEKQAWLIPAIRSHQQAAAMASVWEALAEEFAQLDEAGVDVLADAGRLGLEWFPIPLVQGSRLTLLLTRCTLPALAQAKVWTPWLAEVIEQRGINAGLGLIGPGQPYSAREISRYLGLAILAQLPYDQRSARVFAEGSNTSRRFFNRAPLTGAIRSLAGDLDKRAHQAVKS